MSKVKEAKHSRLSTQTIPEDTVVKDGNIALTTRPCRICGQPFEPTRSQFLHSAPCEPCRRKARAAYSARPEVKEMLREQFARNYKKKKSNPLYKAGQATRQRKYSHDPALRTRHKARWTLYNAIQSGRLQRKPCIKCGEVKSEGHHPDYAKPLEVIWLCRPHHKEVHSALIEKENP